MNRRALVLAADSAVTTTQWNDDGTKTERYFKGANKVFQLSNHQPIGMMIFDSADLHRVPWEMIVKDFRKTLGDHKCGKVEEYAKRFFDFISTNRDMFPDDFREDIFVKMVDRAMMRNLIFAEQDDRVKNATANGLNIDKVRNEVLKELLDTFRSMPIEAPIAQAEIDAMVKLYEIRLTHEADLDIDAVMKGCTFAAKDLIEIGCAAVFKVPGAYLPETGIVIAGYGDNDYFPEYNEYICQGLFSNHLLVKKEGAHRITPDSTGHISAFAQRTMVNTFYLGFSSDVLSAVKDTLRDVFAEKEADVISAVSGTAASLPANVIDDFIERHTDKWARSVFEKHAAPFRSVIGSLPIEELSSLAETLVMLESLKEKVTKPSESVGGPIDVAVITKSEGFIWIKRKHYFDPGLNPRYINRQSM